MRKYLVTRFVAGLLVAAAIIVLILGIVAAGALGLSGGWGPGSRIWLVVPIVIITFFNTALLLVFGAVLFFLTRIEMNFEIVGGKGRPGRPRPHVVPPPSAPTPDRGPSLPVEERAAEAAAVASVAAAAAIGAAEAASSEPVSEPAVPGVAAETVLAEPPAAEEVPPETGAAAPPVSEEPLSSEVVAPEPPAAAPPVSEEPLPSEVVAPEPPAEAPGTIARLPGAEILDDGTSETPEADVADNSGSLKLPGTDAAARIAREMAAFRPAPPAPPSDGTPGEPPAPPEEPAK
jgi:hypothetical protein